MKKAIPPSHTDKMVHQDFKVLVKQPDNYSLPRNYQASHFITMPHGLLGLIGMGDIGTTRDCESSEFSLNLLK